MGRAQDIGSSQSKATLGGGRQSSADATPFLRAVVIDLISDPAYLTDEELSDLFSEISNPGILSGNASVPAYDPEVDEVSKLRVLIPRNSLKIQVVTGGAGKGTLSPSLCFPFFSPHVQLPVKPGEQVWIYNDNPGSPYLYWMSRIAGPGFVDDINIAKYFQAQRALSRHFQTETARRQTEQLELTTLTKPLLMNLHPVYLLLRRQFQGLRDDLVISHYRDPTIP